MKQRDLFYRRVEHVPGSLIERDFRYVYGVMISQDCSGTSGPCAPQLLPPLRNSLDNTFSPYRTTWWPESFEEAMTYVKEAAWWITRHLKGPTRMKVDVSEVDSDTGWELKNILVAPKTVDAVIENLQFTHLKEVDRSWIRRAR